MTAQTLLNNMLGHFFADARCGHFYVYILFRPDGRPFYVGKGVGSRIKEHEREARHGCKCRKCNTIRKIWRDGGEINRQIVFRADDEVEALRFEAQLIQPFRRKLTNIYDHDSRLQPLQRRQRRPTPNQIRRERHARAVFMINCLRDDLNYLRRYGPYSSEAEQRIIEAQEAYRLWLREPEQGRLEGFVE